MQDLVNIPAIVKHQHGDVTLYFYETDRDLILNYEKLDFHLNRFIKLESYEYLRNQLSIKTVDFLVGINIKDKVVSFLSPRAHRELFLLKHLDTVKLSEDSQRRLIKLKEHTERVLSMDLFEFPSSIDQVTMKYDLADLIEEKYEELDELVSIERTELTKSINHYKPSIVERMSDFGLTLTANYDLLRVHLLKFVAIIASLDFDKDGREIKRLFLETMRRLLDDSQKAKLNKLKGTQKALPQSLISVFYFLRFVADKMPSKLFSDVTKFAVRTLAKRFIAGENIEDAQESLQKLLSTKRNATLDQLGELVVSQVEADHYRNEVLKLVRGFAKYVNPGEKNASGILKAHVSIKVSALSDHFNPFAFDDTFNDVAPRLKEILLAGKEHRVFINIDAEHYKYRDLVFDIYKKLLLETPELKDYQQTGIVVQAYLRDGLKHLDEVRDLAKERGLIMPIRLVKGAYWDAETIEADAHSFDAPQFLNKEETDIYYRQLMIRTLKYHPHLQLTVAGHNLRDHCFARVVRAHRFSHTPVIEHQCLHMTYEALSVGMAEKGWCVRNYVPVGSLLVGMAYLVRRIMENSSQVGVLTQMRSHKKDFDIRGPQELIQDKREKRTLVFDKSVVDIRDHFFNNGPVRLYKRSARDFSLEAMDKVKKSLGNHYYTEAFQNQDIVEIKSPSDDSLIVGKISFASKKDASASIERSYEAYNSGTWAKLEPGKRASILLGAAHTLNQRRLELSAHIGFEAGKTFSESLADVDEAIDFIHFYCRSYMKKLGNYSDFVSRGPMAVIGPWNFPIAIPCGMAVAPLLAGNTVILKSAEQTPLIAQILVDILHEAGVPKDVLIHLPGLGETAGQTLVESKKIAGYVFTGSKAVGLHIASSVSGRFFENKLYHKNVPIKVITEMGGKNAIVVTANSELDETVDGILYSAFAHAGQKCSACSRVIIDNRIKDMFAERFAKAAKDIQVGESDNPATYINPLVNSEEKARLYNLSTEIEEEANKYNGKVYVNRIKDDLPGQCVGPMVVELPKHRAYQKDSFSQRELFAPVVHIVGFDGLDEAIEIFNSTEYGLTGGIYSQSQDDIDYLASKLICGNIYINRPNTGARVGIEPFGGMKLSGTGPKAGSPYYMDSFIVDPNGLSDIQVPDVELPTQEVSFELARPSQLSVASRSEKFVEGLKFFIQSFESIYGAVYVSEKAALEDFLYWAQFELVNFLDAHRDNVHIPGQMSYDDLSLTSEHCVYYANNLKPNKKMLMNFLAAIATGSGVTVVCRNSKVEIMWKKILECFYFFGFSRENVQVCFLNKNQMTSVLQNSDVSIYLLDTVLDDLTALKNSIFKCEKVICMKKAIGQDDSPPVKQFRKYFMQFILNRSFAVNTMRHGAPLEIDI